MTIIERLNKHLQDSKHKPSDPFHKHLATIKHSTDVVIKEIKRYSFENKAQAEQAEMQHINEMLGEGQKLLNVRRETADDKKIREIEASTKDMRIQTNILN